MILTAKQSARLDKLLGHLSVYVLEQKGDLDTLDKLYRGDPDGLAGMQVVDYIWGVNRIDGIIDRFVQENPARLNRRDLMQVEDWKSAVFGDFVVVRKQRDVYFLAEDVGFVVRGADDEVDRYLSFTPIMVATAILPFDGLITFALSVAEDAWSRAPYLEEWEALAHIEDLQRSRRLARGGRDFMRLSKECADMLWRFHRERYADRATLVADRFRQWYDEREQARDEGEELVSTEALAPFFERVLVRFGDVEHADEFLRTLVVADIVDELSYDPALTGPHDSLDEMCQPGEPTYRLKDNIAQLKDVELRPLCAVMLDLDQTALDAMSHDKLAEEFARFVVERPGTLIRSILQEGVRGVSHVRWLMEAGGSLYVDAEDLDASDAADGIVPFFPAIYVYHEGGGYRYVMAEEVREALGDVNWDHLEQDARSIERAVADIAQILNYRGIAPAGDLAMEAMGRYDFACELETVLAALLGRVVLGFQPCAVCFIDHAPWLLNIQLFDACDHTAWDGTSALSEPEAVYMVLRRRNLIRPRLITDIVDEADYVDRLLEFSSWQQLADALTRYASKGPEAPFTLADVASLFATECQFDVDAIDSFWDILREVGMEVPTQDEGHIIPALNVFMADIPRWDLNGWSLNDLEESAHDHVEES